MRLTPSAAEDIATRLVELAETWDVPGDQERVVLSQALTNAGFDEDVMLQAFRQVYEESLDSL